MQYKWKKLFKVVLVTAIIAVLGAAVMLLWNWVMPGLYFGISAIDYWHAIALLALCRILFGGFRGHGGRWHARRQWHRWQEMTEQEREQFRQRRPDLCRHGKEPA